VITSRHLVHLVLCLCVMQASTYVLLLAIGWRTGGQAPIYADIPPSTPVVDPVVQALTLTDVVVEATVTAVLLALAVQAHKRFGSLDPDAMTRMRG
jgi:multicomponent Na+:H+ antiporter subunit C